MINIHSAASLEGEYQSVKHDEHERHKDLTESATRQSCRIEERKEKQELNDK